MTYDAVSFKLKPKQNPQFVLFQFTIQDCRTKALQALLFQSRNTLGWHIIHILCAYIYRRTLYLTTVHMGKDVTAHLLYPAPYRFEMK